MPEDTPPDLLNFREFLKAKDGEFGARDRRAKRDEWRGAVGYFLDQVATWIHRVDPEQILDVEFYQVSRTEGSLGTYEVPALRISLGPGQVDLVPVARFVSTSGPRAVAGMGGEPAGRVDLTDGLRKIPLYRKAFQGGSTWHFQDERGDWQDIEPASFVPILQELLS